MNFGTGGALDDETTPDTFIGIGQCVEEVTGYLRDNLHISEGDAVNISDLARVAKVPIDTIKEYAGNSETINFQEAVDCTIKQLAQSNVRSLRRESQGSQLKQDSSMRRMTNGFNSTMHYANRFNVPVNPPAVSGLQTSHPIDPAPSSVSFLGSGSRVFGSIAGAGGGGSASTTMRQYQGFNLAAFNELKSKNQDQAAQLSKADEKIAELKRINTDKDFELAQLRSQFAKLTSNASKVQSVVQQPAQNLVQADIALIQSSFRESLIDIRAMLKDLYTTVISVPPAIGEGAEADESGIITLQTKEVAPKGVISRQVSQIVSSVDTILSKQQSLSQELENNASTLLTNFSHDLTAACKDITSSQETLIDTLGKKLISTHTTQLNEINERLEQLSVLASLRNRSNMSENETTENTEAASTSNTFSQDALEAVTAIRVSIESICKSTVQENFNLILKSFDDVRATVMKSMTSKESSSQLDNNILDDALTKTRLAQINELQTLFLKLETRLMDEISTSLEHNWTQGINKLATDIVSMKMVMDKNLIAISQLKEQLPTIVKSPIPREAILRLQASDFDDSRLLSSIAQAVTFKTRKCLDQYFGLKIAPPMLSTQDENGLLKKPEDLVGSYVAGLNSSIQNDDILHEQSSTFISCLIHTFMESVLPELKAEIQEIITTQLTTHMNTFASEQLCFAKGLCYDFHEIIRAEGGVTPALQLQRQPSGASRTINNPDITMTCEDVDCSMQETTRQVLQSLQEKAPVISGIITKACGKPIGTSSKRDPECLEESALIMVNDENNRVVDVLVNEKELLNICPGLANGRTGPRGKRLSEMSLTTDPVATIGGQSMLETFHTPKFPYHTFKALYNYLPETTAKLDLIEDQVLRQFAEVRSSIEALTKSINTSSYITTSEAARMRQEYRDVAVTIDDVNDGLAAIIESESAKTIANLRHIVLADYVTVTAVVILAIVLFFNLIVMLASIECK